MGAPRLKKCPFCGGKAEFGRRIRGLDGWVAEVRCSNGCASVLGDETLNPTQEVAERAAARRWNRRTDHA